MRLILTAIGMAFVAALAAGTTVPIVGKKLILVDRTATASRAKVVFVSTDPNIQMLSNTPTIHARLDVGYDAVHGTWIMPAGSAWSVEPFPANVAKYVDKSAPASSSVRASTIKHDLLLKVSAPSLGDDAIDISLAPTGPVYVAHSLSDGPSTTRHCTQFAGCVHKVIAGGTGYKLVCRDGSTADSGCMAAPPTTTTTFPPCPPPVEAVWTCCQNFPAASCSIEYRTTGDVATYCATFGGTATPGRCGAPACAAQGCCLGAVAPGVGACADLGIDGTAGEVASAAADCVLLGGTWMSGPCS